MIGRLLGENWEVVRGYLRTYGWVIMGLVAVMIVIQVIRWRIRKGDGESDRESGDDEPAV